MKFIVLLALFLNSLPSYGSETFDLGPDLKRTLGYTADGSYLQFSTTQNLVFASIATGATLYFIKNDEEISKKSYDKDADRHLLSIVSNSAVLFNTPIIPGLFYYRARSTNDLKLKRFSEELLATTLLSMGETVIISAIPFHHRPDEKHLSPVEKMFRGQSSFPSGHVIGFTALGMKSLQFYGPQYAIIPFSLAALTAFERVKTQKHFASDVIASFFITVMASEGVRIASKYEDNHPLYRLIFENNFKVGLTQFNNAQGLKVQWNF